VAVSGVLLFAASFLPWLGGRVTVSLLGREVGRRSFSESAWSYPVLAVAVLAAVAMVVLIAVAGSSPRHTRGAGPAAADTGAGGGPAGGGAHRARKADEWFPGTGKPKLCRESRIFPIGGPLYSRLEFAMVC